MEKKKKKKQSGRQSHFEDFSFKKSTQGRDEGAAMWAALVETQVDSQIESKLPCVSARAIVASRGSEPSGQTHKPSQEGN